MLEYNSQYLEILNHLSSFGTRNETIVDFAVIVFDKTRTRGFVSDLNEVDEDNSECTEVNESSFRNSVDGGKEFFGSSLTKLEKIKISDSLLFRIIPKLSGYVSVINLGLQGTTPWMVYNEKVSKSITYWVSLDRKLSTINSTNCLFKPTGFFGDVSPIPERVIVILSEEKLKLAQLPETPETLLRVIKKFKDYCDQKFWAWNGFSAYLEK